jgi:hypothetical protein
MVDEHESYGELPVRPDDARLIQNLPLPEEVDFTLFNGLDFRRLWAGGRD